MQLHKQYQLKAAAYYAEAIPNIYIIIYIHIIDAARMLFNKQYISFPVSGCMLYYYTYMSTSTIVQ